jgi:hypothetical protein
MRLSLKKGAQAVLSNGRLQEIRGISLVFREMWDTTALNPNSSIHNQSAANWTGAPRSRSVRGLKKTGRRPLRSFFKAYPRAVVTLRSQSVPRRLLLATTVLMMFALLVTQAASFVCGAQCLQHQQPSGTAAAMTHCDAMHPSSNGPAAQTCPPSATSFCVIDLLANGQHKNLLHPTIDANTRPTGLVPSLNLPARRTAFPPQRSTIGHPPLLTPLRV